MLVENHQGGGKKIPAARGEASSIRAVVYLASDMRRERFTYGGIFNHHNPCENQVTSVFQINLILE